MPPKRNIIKKKKKRIIKKYKVPILEEELNSQQKTVYLKQIKDLEDVLEKLVYNFYWFRFLHTKIFKISNEM